MKKCDFCERPLGILIYKVYFGRWDGHGGINWRPLQGIYCNRCADNLVYGHPEAKLERIEQKPDPDN
jgi:hypothetical protein